MHCYNIVIKPHTPSVSVLLLPMEAWHLTLSWPVSLKCEAARLMNSSDLEVYSPVLVLRLMG